MSEFWNLKTKIRPDFDGGLVHNNFVEAGIFIVTTIALRNAIGPLYRDRDGSTTTMAFVTGGAVTKLYMLINNPTTQTTQDSDWQEIPMGNASVLLPQGTWDADNTAPVLQDTDAVDNSGHFYNVTGAPTPIVVTIPGLFGGVATTVKNGDLIISNDVEWYVAPAAVTWEALNLPQVIIDYENGIVIAHLHEISDVNGLQTELDTKFDSADVADSLIDFSLVPDDKLVDVGFLKKYFYTKLETVALLEALPAGSVEGAIQYRNLAGDAFGATDSYFFASSTLTLNTPLLNITGAIVNDDAATKIAAIDDITGQIVWRNASTIVPPVGQYWNTTGTSLITTSVIIDAQANSLIISMGDLATDNGFRLQADLSTDLDVDMLRFSSETADLLASSMTDIYLGPNNGNINAVAVGNISIGQNNAPNHLPVAEWQGGRNIMIGNDIADDWAAPAFNNYQTHNVFIGRRVNASADVQGYSVGIGYEVFADWTGTAGESGYHVAVGIWAMNALNIDALADNTFFTTTALGYSALRSTTWHPSVVFSAGAVTGVFIDGEPITQTTSGATGIFEKLQGSNIACYQVGSVRFTGTTTITGDTSGATYTGAYVTTYSEFFSNIVAVGANAGEGATMVGGFGSVLLGYRAGENSRIEYYNMLFGWQAGANAELGRGNILIGPQAGINMSGGSYGNAGIGTTQFNTGVGTHSMEGLSGFKNSYYGTESGGSDGATGFARVSGDHNSGFGNWTGPYVLGDRNTFLGTYAGFVTTGGTNYLQGSGNTFMGHSVAWATSNNIFDHVIVIGNSRGVGNTDGYRPAVVSNNIYIGSVGDIILETDWNGTSYEYKFINGDILDKNDVSILAGAVAGNDTEIQFNNAGSFGASSDFRWDNVNKTLHTDASSTHTAAPRWSFLTGENNNTIGAGAGSLAWTAIMGDVFVFDNAGTGRSFANGFVTGTGNTVTIANGAFGVFSSNMWGSNNLIEPANSGNYVYTMIGGASNISRNSYQSISGANADLQGIGAFVHGFGDATNKLTVDGDWGVLLSSNTVTQTLGHGVLADNAAIIGGIDHNIPADSHRSVILGGNLIKATITTPDTIFMPKVRMGLGTGGALPTTGETHSLGYNDTTGEVIRTTLGGGSPLTTKGDLYTYDTGDQRLAIGADTLVLTADAAEPTGMKWASVAAGSGWPLTGSALFTGNVDIDTNGFDLQIKVIGGTIPFQFNGGLVVESDVTGGAAGMFGGVGVNGENFSTSTTRVYVTQTEVRVQTSSVGSSAHQYVLSSTSNAGDQNVGRTNVNLIGWSLQAVLHQMGEGVAQYLTGVNDGSQINISSGDGLATVATAQSTGGGWVGIGSATTGFTEFGYLYFDINGASGIGTGVFFQDTRATTTGIEYLADYSSGFTARTLIDKGFADGAYWLNGGTTTVTETSLIEFVPVSNLNISLINNNAFSANGSSGIQLNNQQATSNQVQLLASANLGGNTIAFRLISTAGTSLKADFFDNRGAGLKTGIEYAADYTADFVARSLIDKGYGDATYATIAGGNYWGLTGTSVLTGNTTIQGAVNLSLNITDHINSSGFFVQNAATAIEAASSHGGADGAFIYDPNNVYAQGAGIYFIDYRAGAAQVGLEYNGDYSANYGDRSLIDRGFADGAYWLNGGTTTLAALSTITTSVAVNDIIFENTGTWSGGNKLSIESNQTVFTSDDSAGTGFSSTLFIHTDGMDMSASDGSTTLYMSQYSNEVLFDIDTGTGDVIFQMIALEGIRIADSKNLTGLFYDNDYSTQGIAIKGDRWIPDAGYVNSKIAGLDGKASVKVGTTTVLPTVVAAGSGVGKTLTASSVGILTIDTIATVLGDRILVKNQVAGADNGIYEVTTEGTAGVAFILTRATDADGTPTGEVTSGMYTFIEEGTDNENEGWMLATNNPIVLDTTALVFTQFSAASNGVTEAPNDGVIYGRQSLGWTDIDAVYAPISGSANYWKTSGTTTLDDTFADQPIIIAGDSFGLTIDSPTLSPSLLLMNRWVTKFHNQGDTGSYNYIESHAIADEGNYLELFSFGNIDGDISLKLQPSNTTGTILITDQANSFGMAYAVDYSTAGSASNRWIPDKGYTDATYAPISGGAYWATTGATALTGANIDVALPLNTVSAVTITSNYFAGGFAGFEVAQNALQTGILLSTTNIAGTEETSFYMSNTNYYGEGIGLIMKDTRATPLGIQYAGDYTGSFATRSLIDKGFGDNNYWLQDADFSTTGDRTITLADSSQALIMKTGGTAASQLALTNANGSLTATSVGAAEVSQFFVNNTSGTLGQIARGTYMRWRSSSLESQIHISAAGMQVLDAINTEGMQYAADYSTNGVAIGARWIPDKGYNDSVYEVIGGGAYFSTGADTNATAANVGIVTGTAAADSLFLRTDFQADSSYSYFGLTKAPIGATNKSGYAYIGSFEGTSTEGIVLYFDVTGDSGYVGAVFEDNRVIGSKAGIQYSVDYSTDAGFGARSLIDKGYADGAYILNGGTTNSNAATTINIGTIANNYTFRITGDTGEVEYPELTLAANGGSSGFVVRTAVKTVGLSMADTGVILSYLDTGNQTRVDVNVSGVAIRDDNASTGSFYFADYSTAGAALGARWIPDKGYNDATYLADAADTVANSNLANMAAYTLKGNSTVSAANPTDISISGLTEELTPVALDWILGERADGVMVKYNVGNLPTGGGGEANLIASLGGGLALTAGVTKSGITLQTVSISASGGSGIVVSSATDLITVDLDINSLATETTIADGDFMPFWDITATATNKKITFANLKTAIGGSGAFTADVDTQITPSAAIVLDHATNNEIALAINYTTNKAAGNDTGLVINQVDTLSPGTSFLIDAQVGGTSKFTVDNIGTTFIPVNSYLYFDGIGGSDSIRGTGADIQIRTGGSQRLVIAANSITASNIDNFVINNAPITSSATDDYSFKVAQTLNDTVAGTETYHGIWADITTTDTTGWSNVYLMDLQNDGASRFIVDAAGNISIPLGQRITFNGIGGTEYIYSNASTLELVVGGSTRIQASTTAITLSLQTSVAGVGLFGITSTAAILLNEAASATNPTLAPNRQEVATGIGSRAADVLNLISASVTGIELTKATAQVNVEIGGNAGSMGGTIVGDGVLRINDATTNPTGTVVGGGLLYVDGNTLNYLDAAGTATDLTAGGSSLANTTTNFSSQTDFGTTSDSRIRFETVTADKTVGDAYFYNGDLTETAAHVFNGIVYEASEGGGDKFHLEYKGPSTGAHRAFMQGGWFDGNEEVRLEAYKAAATVIQTRLRVSDNGTVSLSSLYNANSKFASLTLSGNNSGQNVSLYARNDDTTGNHRVLEIGRRTGAVAANDIAGSFALLLQNASSAQNPVFEVQGTHTDVTNLSEESLVQFYTWQNNAAHEFLSYRTDVEGMSILGTAPVTYGTSAVGVMYVNNATAIPTGDPTTGGGVFYASGNNLYWRGNGGGGAVQLDTAGGSGAFTADVETEITPTTAIALTHATIAQIGLDLSMTVNKAAGASTLLFADVTTTTALTDFLDFQDDTVSKFKISAGGAITMSGGLTLSTGAVQGVALLNAAVADSFGLSGGSATATVPTLLPDRGDGNTGIGQAAADQLSLISGGVEGIRLTKATTDVNIGFNGASFADMDGGIFLGTATTVPTTNPTGGGLLYVTGTSLSFRDTAGTVTDLTGAASGDMLLAGVQTVTGAKTFGTIGGTVGKLILAGSTSGSSILNAAAVAGATTLTLPGSTDTLVGKATTDVFTNKTLDADGTGNVITNIGSSEIKSEMITGFTTVTAASGDFVLISDTGDAGNLKKVNALDFLGGGAQTPWTANVDAATFYLYNVPSIRDANQNELLTFNSSASAISHLEISNAAAAGSVRLSAAGDEVNVDLILNAKGTDAVRLSVNNTIRFSVFSDHVDVFPAQITSSAVDDYGLKLTQTLNDTVAGTETYHGLWADITETDITGWSNVYLMDLQVGGASKFTVDNAGNVYIPVNQRIYLDGIGGDDSIYGGSGIIRLETSGVEVANFGNAVSLKPKGGATQGFGVQVTNTTYNASTALRQSVLEVLGTINQTVSALGYTGIFLDVTETAIVGTANYLIDAKVGGTSKFTVDNLGNVYIPTDQNLYLEGIGGNTFITSGGTGNDILSIAGGNTSFQVSTREIRISPGSYSTSTTDDYALSIIQTLNDATAAGGTDVYRGIKMNIIETDITGWNNVYLMDLQVGGASRFAVVNDGSVRMQEITAPTTDLAGYGVLYIDSTSSNLSFRDDGGTVTDLTAGGGSPLTTKGDIFTYSTVDDRLPVGTNGLILSADSAQTTGLNWISPTGSSAGANNEVQTSDGASGFVGSKMFVDEATANVILGDAGLAGTPRTISVAGSGANIGLTLAGKGSGNIIFEINTATRFTIGNTSIFATGFQITVANANGGALAPVTSSATVPTILPDKSDTNTGLGRGGTDIMALVANAKSSIWVDGTSAVATNIGLIATTTPDYNAGDGVIFIADATTNPTVGVVTGGGILYVDGNALNWLDAGGTVTNLAASGGGMATDILWDAVGDLAVGTGADTGAKLTVGATDALLTVVGGTPAWTLAPTNLTSVGLNDTDSLFNLILQSTSTITTADKTLTIDVNDTSSTLGITATTTLSGGTHSGTNTGDQTTSSATTNQLTVATGAGDPALTIVTAAVAAAETGLATGDQINTYVKALAYVKALTVETPTATEDITMFFTDVAITITQVNDVVRGATPSITFNIVYGTDRSAAGTNLWTADRTTSSVSGAETVTFDNAAIAAGSWVWFESQAVGAATDEANVTLEYTID